MVKLRISDTGDDQPDTVRLIPNLPTLVGEGKSWTAPQDWYQAQYVYPAALLVEPSGRDPGVADRAPCPCHPRSWYQTHTVHIRGYGTVVLAGTICPDDGAVLSVATAIPSPWVARELVGMIRPRPPWLPDMARQRESAFGLRRLEHMLIGAVATAYQRDPATCGGPAAILACLVEQYKFKGYAAIRNSADIDLTDPLTW